MKKTGKKGFQLSIKRASVMIAEYEPQKTAIVYSDGYLAYNLGELHPMNPKRMKAAYGLIKATGFFKNGVNLVPPVPATDEEILLSHDAKYVEILKDCSLTGNRRLDYGLGTEDCPVFPEMHDASALIVGGTLQALRTLLNTDHQIAFNVLGGLHHAQRELASGFCYYNDIVVAIEYLWKEVGQQVRILYIDLDCHHGDGVQKAFFDTDRVMTISLHESGKYLYPNTGFTYEVGYQKGRFYSVNVPLLPYTDDSTYLQAFKEIVLPLWRRYDPEFVVVQNGVDTHFNDPQADLILTTRVYHTLASLIVRMARESGVKFIATGGGGYDPASIARSWCAFLSGYTGIELPDYVPDEWVQYCLKEKIVLKSKPPIPYFDDPIDISKIANFEMYKKSNLQTIENVKRMFKI
ncbi:MAG: acetoin utilization protein AcuC [Candidatus Odinarchaeota archaeon]